MKLVNQSKNMPINTLIFLILLLLPIRHVITQCRSSEWMCDNQVTCIDDDEQCDGQIDCPDGSDEIAVNCFNTTICPIKSFQCSYGACISGLRKCNGIPDCADKSDELFCPENTAVTNLQGSCRSNDEMQCLSSNECIDISDTCDGRVDCSDGSDETLELCGREECPTGFRCAYGACVSGYARCNGTVECKDGSDEAWISCGYTRKFPEGTTSVKPILGSRFKPQTEDGLPPKSTTSAKPIVGPTFKPLTEEGLPCKVPEDSSRLVIKLLRSEEQLKPGAYVPDDESIHAECVNKNDEGADLYCLNGVWKGGFPKCDVFCDKSELQGISTTYICHQYGTLHDTLCTSSILPNTSFTLFCSQGYRRSLYPRSQELRCDEDGVFNEKRIPCAQHCGQLTPTVRSLTKNGFAITPSKAPWHVSIYRNDGGEQIHICGGSIISPRLIISAAHCFWNKTVQTSSHLYRIIAGKLSKKYAVDKDEGVPQNIEIDTIYISEEYNDQNELNNHFYADIAIIKLIVPLIYNENVSSICMSYPVGDSKDYVKSNLIGSVTGYGRSGILERLSLATVSNNECQTLRDGSSLAGDKFCVRNDNINSTICQGDSGGGFVEMRNNAFHLLGIVSYTPSTQASCVTADFVALSNVRYMRKDLLNVSESEMESDKKLF